MPTSTVVPTLDGPPEEPDQPQQYEQDQALPWQQQEALVQHIADREGVFTICVSTCLSVHVMYATVLYGVGIRHSMFTHCSIVLFG